MRLPRRSEKQKTGKPGPEDTQEMFTAGQSLPEDATEEIRDDAAGNGADPEATREYEAVAVDEKEAPEVEAGTGEAETLIEDDESVEAIEEEAWEGDEYEEWEEEDFEAAEDDEVDDVIDGTVEGSAAGSGTGDGSGRSRGDDLKVWFEEFRGRVRTVAGALLTRIGSIKLPNHEIDGQKAMAVGGIVLIAGLVGVGGYVVGKSSGDDLDTARLEGEFAGKRTGAVEGATSGYAAGFKKGRDLAFRKSYASSYRRNYIRAYEDVGMEPPKPGDIEVPEP